MILVSDAHVSRQRGNHRAFFRMLRALENTDDDLVFLGDIFDLWIALPRYENALHRRYLDWCRAQGRRRRIGFVEGNHEYFVAQERNRYFTWCTDTAYLWEEDGTLFCHGDQINRRDIQYLRFRKLSKNRLTRLLLRGLLPGPRLAALVKIKMKATNPEFRKTLPREEIALFGEKGFREGVRRIFAGHFHQQYRYCNDQGRCLYTLPGWCTEGQITRYEPATGSVRHLDWRLLPEAATSRETARP